MNRARDILAMFGLTDEDIAHIAKEEGMDRARFQLRSPVDGKVTWVEAVPGKSYAKGHCLIQVAGSAAQKHQKP